LIDTAMSVMYDKNVVDIFSQFNIYYEGFGIEINVTLTQIFFIAFLNLILWKFWNWDIGKSNSIFFLIFFTIK
jgi:hypothetical protein